MFGESTVGNVVGVGIVLLFGAYVHHRVSIRRTQTRLAVCMLEEDDCFFVDELDRLVRENAIQPIKDPYEIPLSAGVVATVSQVAGKTAKKRLRRLSP